MNKALVAGGTAHAMPKDLRAALLSSPSVLAIWQSLTPLARNEWICWDISVKKEETRQEHIKRTVSELKEGMRRPCCSATALPNACRRAPCI